MMSQTKTTFDPSDNLWKQVVLDACQRPEAIAAATQGKSALAVWLRQAAPALIEARLNRNAAMSDRYFYDVEFRCTVNIAMLDKLHPDWESLEHAT